MFDAFWKLCILTGLTLCVVLRLALAHEELQAIAVPVVEREAVFQRWNITKEEQAAYYACENFLSGRNLRTDGSKREFCGCMVRDGAPHLSGGTPPILLTYLSGVIYRHRENRTPLDKIVPPNQATEPVAKLEATLRRVTERCFTHASTARPGD